MKLLNNLKKLVCTAILFIVLFIVPAGAEQFVEMPGVIETGISIFKTIAILGIIGMILYLGYLINKPKRTKRKSSRRTPASSTEYTSAAVEDWKNKMRFRDIEKNISISPKKQKNLLEKVKEDLADATEIERIQYYAQLQKTSS